MTQMPTALAAIALDPPGLDVGDVAVAVGTQFGLRGDYRALISERDQNFRLTTPGGDSYVVKVTSAAESPEVSDFQISALLYLEDAGLAGVPRIVLTRSGQKHACIASESGTEYRLRVVSYLDGELLNDSELTRATARGFGRRVAALDLALQDFSHASENQILLWDTQRAGELLGLCGHMTDAAMRAMVEAVLSDFEQRVLPQLKSLPHQVIHNDANAENVLLDANGAVSGFIDFGDMLRAPRIVEVSTAASYLRSRTIGQLPLIAAFVSGYCEKNLLGADELDLLFDLVRTRLSMTLTILHWRLSARDKNDPYRQKSLSGEQDTIRALTALSEMGGDVFRERIATPARCRSGGSDP